MVHMNLIYERAWSFHRTTGINFDDLVSVADQAYAEKEKEFNPDYGVKFTTFMYKALTNKLTDYCRELKSVPVYCHEEILQNQSCQPDFDRILGKVPEINPKLNPDVKELIKVILDNQNEFKEQQKENRGILRRILRQKYGWAHGKISATFLLIQREIKLNHISQLFTYF